PAAPGAAQGGRRGLSLPPDAHPAQRVGMPATGQARLAAAPGRPSGGGAWWARSLGVAGLRPWRRAPLERPPGLVGGSGPDGAGEASLVEAIVLGTLGVSPRTARESEAVRRGAQALRVALELEGPDGPSLREIGVQAGLGRRLRVDGQAVRALAAWRVHGAVLVFLPEELRSVKGPPAARRRVVDRLGGGGARRGGGGPPRLHRCA